MLPTVVVLGWGGSGCMKQPYLHYGLLQAGKYSKRQAFVLPGDINKLLRIRACSVSVYLTCTFHPWLNVLRVG